MKTITTKTVVYKFSELNESQQQRAIENLYDINVDYGWWESVYEDAANVGIKITSFDIGRGSYCNGDFLLSANEVAQNIMNEHGEHCETYKTAVSFMNDWQPVFSSYMDETDENYESRESEEILLEIEDEFKKSVLEDYRIMLSNEYDYLAGKEAIIETIKANDYDFTAEGRIF